MRSWRMRIGLLLLLTMVVGLYSAGVASAAGHVELYTPYVNLDAAPGQTVNYSVEVINHGSETRTVTLLAEDVPADWEYELTSGAWKISQLAVKAGETENVNLKITVPLAVEKGIYRFELSTDQGVSLPLTVNITEQGTFRTELTSNQPNLEGKSDATFTYTVELNNKTAEQQTYALRADAPAGWDVTFLTGGKAISSVIVEPNTSQNLTVNVTPAANVTADKYTIPIEAASGSTGSKLELEAVITGTYDMQLTTSNDLLSADLTAGGSKKINLVLKNTGSSDLKDISMSSVEPAGWDVEFDRKEKISIKAGESQTIVATIKSNSKAISGDYRLSITARSPEVSKSADFRVAVKTSVLWGWLGILIIAAVFGGIYYLFRKYGRR